MKNLHYENVIQKKDMLNNYQKEITENKDKKSQDVIFYC